MDWEKIEKYKNEKVLRLDSLCIEKSMVCHDTCPCCNCQIDGWLEILLEQLLIKQVRYLIPAFSQITREIVSVLRETLECRMQSQPEDPITFAMEFANQIARTRWSRTMCLCFDAFILIVHTTHFSSIEIVLLQEKLMTREVQCRSSKASKGAPRYTTRWWTDTKARCTKIE